MADPIGTSSGALALVVFAFNVAALLHEALGAIAHWDEAAAELRNELQSLQIVLTFLKKAVSQDIDGFKVLDEHLQRCGHECGKLLKLVKKCTPQSKGVAAKISGYTKSKFLDNEFASLRKLINQDKATITLVLGGLNLSRFTVTAEAIDEFQQIAVTTMADIKQNIQDLEKKQQSLFSEAISPEGKHRIELEQLQVEKKKCEDELAAFSRVLELLQEVDTEHIEVVLGGTKIHKIVENVLHEPLEDRMTAAEFQTFTKKVPLAIADIQQRLTSVEDEMQNLCPRNRNKREKYRRYQKINEHSLELLKRLHNQADEKRMNVLRDAVAATNARQIAVSTFGHLINCENLKAESGATQILGQMSDASLQLTFQTQPCQAPTEHKVWHEERKRSTQGWVIWLGAAVFAHLILVIWIT